MLKIYPNGFSLATADTTGNNPNPPLRLPNKGWTKHAAMRNNRFLYSVPLDSLTGQGWSCTLTIGDDFDDCPSPVTFHIWIKELIRALERTGRLLRYHWVIEWQQRGVPHLHAVVYESGISCCQHDGGDTGFGQLIESAWLKYTAPITGASSFGQDVKPIKDSLGWLKYLAKHGSRSISNYQRNPESVPISWANSTGRMWGKAGDWNEQEPLEVVEMSTAERFAHRRIAVKYLAACNRGKEHRYWSTVSV